MEDQKDASQFFSEHKLRVQADQEFKNQLKTQIFENYLNSYNTTMEETKKPLLSRKGIWGALAFTLIIALGVSAFFFTQNSKDVEDIDLTNDSKLGGTIALFDGDLEIQSETGWNDAVLDSSITEGQTYRVSGDGRAVFNLDDGSSVRLNSNSQVTFVALNPDDIKISNDSGEVYTRVVKMEREFNVIAGNAEFQSLGTAYKTVNTGEKKGVEVYHSKVAVKLNSEEVTKVNEGESYYFGSEKTEQLDVEKLKNDEFVKWNKDLDSEDFSDQLGILEFKQVEGVTNTQTKSEEVKPAETQPAPQPAPQNVPQPSLVITSITPKSGGFKVFWSAANLDTSSGFKVVYNTYGGPEYGRDYAQYANPGDTYAGVGVGAGTYFVKVCRYTGGGCDNYSNEVSVTVAAQPSNPAPNINSISLSYSGNTLNWSTDTGSTGYGFKILRGTSSVLGYGNKVAFANGLTYTGSEIMPGYGYYYAVCAYYDSGSGGTCHVVSNSVQIP